MLKHFVPGQVRIYPKGLHAAELYDVRFQVAKSAAKRTGEDLAKRDHVNESATGRVDLPGPAESSGERNRCYSPTAPAHVTKGLGTNMGTSGVELHWTASSDNNWISYYQVYRDGEPIDRVSKGLYDFDHSEVASHGAIYQVQAVDGDGNVSAKVTAAPAGTGAEVYTALGGYLAGSDYSYQGANGWSIEEGDGNKRTPATWNGALGQMGLYEGAPGEHQLLIGASWMRPGSHADAIRVFTLPAAGQVSITANVHKDLYHTSGNGVRVRYCRATSKSGLLLDGDDCSRRHQGQGRRKDHLCEGWRKTLFHRQR